MASASQALHVLAVGSWSLRYRANVQSERSQLSTMAESILAAEILTPSFNCELLSRAV